jgi:hypothetical protein
MPTKRELEREVKGLKEQLKKNQELMRDAALRAEELMGLEEECRVLKTELERLKNSLLGTPSQPGSKSTSGNV